MTVERLTDLLHRLDLKPTEEDILGLLWLASWIDEPQPTPTGHTEPPGHDGGADGELPADRAPPAGPEGPHDDGTPELAARPPAAPAAPAPRLHLAPVAELDAALAVPAAALRVPAVPALDRQLDLGRALRPLKRRRGFGGPQVLDEEATATQIAERHIWVPAYRPVSSRWLELALVVDGYESMSIWDETIGEFRTLLEGLGVFSDVRFWTLDAATDPARLCVRKMHDGSAMRSPGELMDSAGRRVIALISDCLGPAWRAGSAQRLLAEWGRRGPVAVLQPLPQRLWSYTHAWPVPAVLRAFRPGAPNAQLSFSDPKTSPDSSGSGAVPVPVLELGPDWLASWSRLITGTGASGVDAMVIFAGQDSGTDADELTGTAAAIAPRELVQRFRASSSPEAFRLAVHLSAAPISLPVIRLVQEVMLGAPNQAQIAEVFLGGLLCRQEPADGPDYDQAQYDFIPGVRDLLLRRLRRNEALTVLDRVSRFIDVHFGQARDFQALLSGAGVSGDYLIDHRSRPFAIVAEHVLRLIGGQYARPADRLAAALGLRSAVAGDLGKAGSGFVADDPSAGVTVGVSDPSLADRAPGELAPEQDESASGVQASFAQVLAQIPLPVRRSRWSPLVCPYCYEAFGDRDILFRCSGRSSLTMNTKPCAPRQDRKLLEKMGQDLTLPPAFPADGRKDEATCPDCRQPTRTQVCPGCHSRLPANFRTVQGRLIALVGPSQAGKTAFMTVLIHELRHQAGELLDSSTIGADDTTQDRYMRRYEWPLYTQSRPFERTIATQDLLSPLVFRFTQNQRSRFRTYQKALLLSFIDSAGEDLVSDLKIELMVNYLAAADAVIVMLDPLQFPGARNALEPFTALPSVALAVEQPSVALERITKMLKVGTGEERIEKPVAVVLTKLDMLTPLLPQDSVLRAPAQSATHFDYEESAKLQAETTTLLAGWGALDIDRIVRSDYVRPRYFAVSSLGAAPAPGNSAPDQGIQPYRILDPFAWLLSQFGFGRS
jgi:hypothetical protein